MNVKHGALEGGGFWGFGAATVGGSVVALAVGAESGRGFFIF